MRTGPKKQLYNTKSSGKASHFPVTALQSFQSIQLSEGMQVVTLKVLGHDNPEKSAQALSTIIAMYVTYRL